MGSEDVIYGNRNGDLYTVTSYEDGEPGDKVEKTFWSPFIEVDSDPLHNWMVLRIIPVNEDGTHDRANLTLVELSRGGANRLVRATRKHRDRAFGKDE